MDLRTWAKTLKQSCAALLLAMKHPETPWYAKALGSITLLYALSPIDLIPDFIPILGYLDDLILVPIGLWLTVKCIPPNVWLECQNEVARRELGKPAKNWKGLLLVIGLWIAILVLIWYFWASK